MDKEIVVYSFNEIIFINRKNEPLPHTIRIWMNFIDIMMSKRRQAHKSAICKILFIQSSRSGKTNL